MTTKRPRQLHYIIFNKPYGVLCQFSTLGGKDTLANYGPFPRDVYPAGRLDTNSEGLVLLTNDGKLKHLLIEPHYKHPRTYLVQVERVPADTSLSLLRAGVVIDGKQTRPCKVQRLSHDPKLPPRAVPIRFRRTVSTAWLTITLYEGRNRQVRKMTAAAGHPTLRLVRIQIANLTLGDLAPGEHRTLSAKEIHELRRILANEITSRKT